MALTPELESLLNASRQIDASIQRERQNSAQLQAELTRERARHAQDVARARQLIAQLRERDAEMIKRLKHAHEITRSSMTQAKQIKEQNTRLQSNAQEQSRKIELDLTAARTAVDHLRGQIRLHEDAANQLKNDQERIRADLERAQAEVLEREHRYQWAALQFQGRDRAQQTAITALQGEIKQTKTELARAKDRWVETERLRQDSERRREQAELAAAGKLPSQERLRKLEEANQQLQDNLAAEKRRRKDVEKALPSAEMGQEMNRMRAGLEEMRERLAYTEAQLTKASAEAAILKAVRKSNAHPPEIAPAQSYAGGSAAHLAPAPIDFALLERLALPGYPVTDS